MSLGGRAGTGKSVLALAAGLEAVVEQRTQRRIVVFRPIFAVGGQELGYLPGSETEKMSPWAAAVFDALESVVGREVVAHVQSRNQLEVLPLTHIRGRTLTDTFVIIDEAQNLERGVLLTALSRLGEGSRVVLTHDVAQRDNLRVGRHDGVVSVIETLKGHPLFAHLTLTRSERSPIAALVSELLEGPVGGGLTSVRAGVAEEDGAGEVGAVVSGRRGPRRWPPRSRSSCGRGLRSAVPQPEAGAEAGLPLVAVDGGLGEPAPQVDAVVAGGPHLGQRRFQAVGVEHPLAEDDDRPVGALLGGAADEAADVLRHGLGAPVAVLGHGETVGDDQPDQIAGVGEAGRGDRSPVGQRDLPVPQRGGPGPEQVLHPPGPGPGRRLPVGGADLGDVEAGRHRRAAPQHPPRLAEAEVEAGQGVEEATGVGAAGWGGAGQVAGAGQAERRHDRHPGVRPLAEQLGAALDVAGPEVGAGPAVAEAPLVEAEPAGQRAVDERDPRPQPGVDRGGEDLLVVLDRPRVDPAVLRLEAGPLGAEAHVGEPDVGEQAQVAPVVGGEAVAVGRVRRSALPLPVPPVRQLRRPLRLRRREPHPPGETPGAQGLHAARP